MGRKLSDIFVHPGHLIRRSHQIYMSVFEEEFSAHNISPVQFVLLIVISALEETDLKTASGIAAIDKASCTRATTRLIERDLIKLVPDALDQRRKLVKLTRTGQTLLPELFECAGGVEKRLLQALAQNERSEFIDRLAHFVKANNKLSRAPQKWPEEFASEVADTNTYLKKSRRSAVG